MSTTFKKLGLISELLTEIEAKGYTKPTPIQEKSIPMVLAGDDILAGAQTGTGKTAAFALPILQKLTSVRKKGKSPRALIVTPTRELASQILESIEEYGKGLQIRSTVIFGGVSYNPQKERLKKGIDILVATPGRLLDHVGQGTLDLSRIEILVLDEADRMLDMGFVHDIRKILKVVPPKRQNLLFSATYTEEIKRLADKILNSPKYVEVAAENSTVDTIYQVFHPVDRKRKRELLAKLINEGEWKQTLVFTRTKHGANRLAKQLEKDKISASAIHGNKSQAARTKALADFKNGELKVLVATDIAARGIDINLLPNVVNYDLPEISESYVHRIGRTGRAGANGKATSFVCPQDHKEIAGIKKILNKKKLPFEPVEGFEIDLTIIPEKEEQPKPQRKDLTRKTGEGYRKDNNNRFIKTKGKKKDIEKETEIEDDKNKNKKNHSNNKPHKSSDNKKSGNKKFEENNRYSKKKNDNNSYKSSSKKKSSNKKKYVKCWSK